MAFALVLPTLLRCSSPFAIYSADGYGAASSVPSSAKIIHSFDIMSFASYLSVGLRYTVFTVIERIGLSGETLISNRQFGA